MSLDKFADSEVGSRDPVYNFCTVEPITVRLLWLVTSDDIMTSLLKKVINRPIDQNSRSQTAMFGFQIVDRIRRQSS